MKEMFTGGTNDCNFESVLMDIKQFDLTVHVVTIVLYFFQHSSMQHLFAFASIFILQIFTKTGA